MVCERCGLLKQTNKGRLMNYYDITDLVNHARFSTKVSGIQRVVFEGMKTISDNDRIFFISPVTGNKYIIRNINKSSIDDLTTLVNLFLIADFSGEINRSIINKYVSKFAGNKSRKWQAIESLLNKVIFAKFNPFSIWCCNKFVSLAKSKFSLTSKYEVESFDEFDDIDNLILFGGVWNFQDKYETIISQARSKGANVIFMVYDMIPIVCEFVPDELRVMFSDYIPFALKHADKIIVNSSSCKSDLTEFCDSNGIAPPNIGIVHLAHYLPQLNKSIDSLALPLRTRKLSKEKFILCVGSIESRKNHINLLITWKKFVNSDDYNNEKLVIVGRFLWDVEAVQSMLQTSGNLYGTVCVIESASEEELRYLYESCLFTVYPSHYEGWGLPLGESLSYRKPCLHFDNSSLVEAGYGMTTAVPYPDYEAFYSTFNSLITDNEYYKLERKKICIERLRTWDDFSLDISRELTV